MTEKILYDDFAKLEIKTGKILSAEKMANSHKLLRLQVDIGEPTPRTILAGIAPFYATEALVGKRVIVLANLAPKKMAGDESNGMVLMAEGPEKAIFLMTEEDTAVGLKIC